jgi:hypothetical protein
MARAILVEILGPLGHEEVLAALRAFDHRARAGEIGRAAQT